MSSEEKLQAVLKEARRQIEQGELMFPVGGPVFPKAVENVMQLWEGAGPKEQRRMFKTVFFDYVTYMLSKHPVDVETASYCKACRMIVLLRKVKLIPMVQEDGAPYYIEQCPYCSSTDLQFACHAHLEEA